MHVRWALTAQAFVDQLPKREQAKVAISVERLADNWDALRSTHLYRLQGVHATDGKPLYVLRAGKDLRVLLYIDEDAVVVVDVVRHSQIERLRSIQRRFEGSSE